MTSRLEACLAFLRALDGVAPDEALERVGALRAELGCEVELFWQREPGVDRVEYDLVIAAAGAGTVSLAWAAEVRGVPFAMRGMQRLQELELVRVDGRSLWMHEAIVLLDSLWGESRIRQRIVDFCILRRELEREPYRAAPDELQQAVDQFRRARGLASAEETTAWLDANGMSLAELEDQLEGDLARAHLRRAKVGAQAEAEFARDAASYDELRVAAFAAADAEALAADIRAGADFLEVARRGGARGIMLDSVRRRVLDADGALEAGATVVGRIAGAGPYVVSIAEVAPAAWDERTREAVEEVLFRHWFDRAIAQSRVEWNWGPAA